MQLSPAAQERLAWRRRHSGKDCPTCGRALPLSAFGADPRKPDGLEHRCKACEASRKRLRRARPTRRKPPPSSAPTE